MRSCVVEDGWAGDPDAEDQVEPPYTNECEIKPANKEFENYDLFTNLQERFVNFEGLDDYEREGEDIEAIKSTSVDGWVLAGDVSLSEFVVLVNGAEFETENIAGFVNAASDFLRKIEFVHNYDPPVDLYCTYNTSACGAY